MLVSLSAEKRTAGADGAALNSEGRPEVTQFNIS